MIMDHDEILEIMQKLIKKIHTLMDAKCFGRDFDEEYYESLRHRLQQLEDEFPKYRQQNSPSFVIGPKPINRSLITHKYPMRSIRHTYNQQEAEKWLDQFLKLGSVVVSPKIDGIAVSLGYENGHLIYGSLRGNGIQGEDITEFLLLNNCCPVKIATKKTIVVRGELALKAGKDRAQLSGAVRQKEPTKMSNLCFYAYGLFTEEEPLDTQLEDLSFLSKYFTVTPHELCTKIKPSCNDKKTAEFDQDGQVFRLNNHALANQLGYTERYPKFLFSLKTSGQKTLTTLRKVTWQMNRDGSLTPVLWIEPKKIEHILLRKVNGYNYRYLKSNNLGPGSKISVGRIGNSAPQLINIIKSTNFIPLEYCPFCSSKVFFSEIHYRCPNESCSEMLYLRTKYFFQKLGIKGIGYETIVTHWNGSFLGFIKKMLRDNWARDLREIKLQEQLRALKPNMLDLLVALGIPGNSRASLEKILKGTLSEGKKIDSLQKYLSSNQKIINYLCETYQLCQPTEAFPQIKKDKDR
jgi:DNA ligase (NAD+)